MYGPRAILVCGFQPEERNAFIMLRDSVHLGDVPVIFARTLDRGERLGDLLLRPDQAGRDDDSVPERAVIMSGITEDDLHRILGAYRKTGLARPLWATLTPTSESWTLSVLLEEFQQERRAMEKNKS